MRPILVAALVAGTGLTGLVQGAAASLRATARAPMVTTAGMSGLPQAGLGQRRPASLHRNTASSHLKPLSRMRFVTSLTPARVVQTRPATLQGATSHTATATAARISGYSNPEAPPAYSEEELRAAADAWPWRRVARPEPLPANAGTIRKLDARSRALDGSSFVSGGVIYVLRGLGAPAPGTPQAAAALWQLQSSLDSGERVLVYPTGFDRNGRLLADVVVGDADLASLLRTAAPRGGAEPPDSTLRRF